MWDMGYEIWERTQEFAGGIYLTSSTLWNPACGGFARGEIPQGKSHISHPPLKIGSFSQLMKNLGMKSRFTPATAQDLAHG
jgi:hypothetical protein